MIKGLFVEEIDWTDPRFRPWNIKNLGELNDAQLDALMDDDVSRIKIIDFDRNSLGFF